MVEVAHIQRLLNTDGKGAQATGYEIRKYSGPAKHNLGGNTIHSWIYLRTLSRFQSSISGSLRNGMY